MASILFYITLLLYGFSSLFYLFWLVRTSDGAGEIARKILLLGFTIHFLAVLHRFAAFGHLQLTNIHDILSVLSMSIVGAYIVIDRRYKVVSLGTIITPFSFLLLIGSSTAADNLLIYNPTLHNFWIYLHTILAFISYSLFTVAAATACIYLILTYALKTKLTNVVFAKLPSLEKLDVISYRCLALGFPMLTVALIVGSFIARDRWGNFWSWDIKQIWSLAIWLVYALLLHGRHTFGWQGKRAALLSLAGIALIATGLIVVNVWFPGLHTFSQ